MASSTYHDDASELTNDQFEVDNDFEEEEVELEMPQARDNSIERERHGVRLELSVPRYLIMKKLLDERLIELKDDITSEEFFAVFDLASYIRTRAKGLKGLEE
jgi:hypothetical protein